MKLLPRQIERLDGLLENLFYYSLQQQWARASLAKTMRGLRLATLTQ
ncbi:hypothetical protein [Burkholderia sp. B21-005]|nr:hypothetical protein [Burkholderia sp. B21-005]UEP40686.1 hypothetical protein LMA02_12700 [Burkholderia sp. B21-005]